MYLCIFICVFVFVNLICIFVFVYMYLYFHRAVGRGGRQLFLDFLLSPAGVCLRSTKGDGCSHNHKVGYFWDIYASSPLLSGIKFELSSSRSLLPFPWFLLFLSNLCRIFLWLDCFCVADDVCSHHSFNSENQRKFKKKKLSANICVMVVDDINAVDDDGWNKSQIEIWYFS